GSSAAADRDATWRPSRINAPPSTPRRGRGSLKMVLILTGAAICFAAGAAASKFTILSFEGVRLPTLTSTTRPSAPAEPAQYVDTKAVESKPSERAESKANQPSAAGWNESARVANAGTPAASPQRENAATATPWINPPAGSETKTVTEGRGTDSAA